MVRGIRGAITVEVDREAEILDATEELIKAIIKQNQIDPEMVAQILITVTEDIVATFPAKAIRRFAEWSLVPIVCAREIPVPNSLARCIRVLMTVNTDKEQSAIKHIYLREAKQLRPDLSLTKEGHSR